MSNYVPHYTKKKERLASGEEELLRAIRDGHPRETLLRLADEVKLAIIRVLRAERARLGQHPVGTPAH